MQKKRKHIDTADLMVEINHIINENVEIEYQDGEGLVEPRRFDISQIDLDLLAAEFTKVKRKNLIIKDLNDLVQERLSKMMSVNPSRVDYYVRYMGIIETYNAEQDRSTIEKTFMELMDLAKSLSEEEKRYAREEFSSDEELSIYDLLFSDNLSKSDINKIKKMSKDLLQKINERIAGMDHWTDKQETRASVDILIRNVFYEEIKDSMFDRLEAYTRRQYTNIFTRIISRRRKEKCNREYLYKGGTTMRKAVVITKFIPAPTFSGGAIRNRAWIRFLCKYYNIIIIGFWDKKYGNTRTDELKEYVEEIIGFDFVRTKSMLIKTALKAFTKKQAVVLQQYYLAEMQETINSVLANQDISLIFCEELATMQYVKHVHNIPIVFDDHNIEYELQERSAMNCAILLKALMRREAHYVKRFELFAWEHAKLCYFVSERDCQIAKDNSTNKSFDVVENTFSSKGIVYRRSTEWFSKPTCVFVGNMSWKPNHYGLIHFFEKIYPKVKERIDDFELMLLGSSVPDDLRVCAKNAGAKIIENIEEEEKVEVLSKCWLAIVPIYSGSGTRIKILEYWAHSKAVLSTGVGAEGLRSCAGTIIKDSDEDIANEIIQLLNNKLQLEGLGRLNREIFTKYYEEKTVYADSLYNSLSAKLNG